MKKHLLKTVFLLTLFSNLSVFAQGTLVGVTPPVGSLSSTVTLQISGSNTMFTQASTALHHSLNDLTLLPNTQSLINDSTVTAEYTIPNNAFYAGYWDVFAYNAPLLQSGFYVEPNGVVVSGCLYRDEDVNCFFDPTEVQYGGYGFTVKVQPGNITAQVNSQGRYAVELPLGTYAASVEINPPNFWNNGILYCDTLQNIFISAPTPEIIYEPNFAVATKRVKGNIYADSNNDCVLNANENKMGYGWVRYSSTNQWASVQPNGTYEMDLNNFTLSGNLSYTVPYWYYNPTWGTVTCPASGVLPLTFPNYAPALITNKNFGLDVDTCPKIRSNIYIAGSRPCFNSRVYVSVYNISPNTAYNVNAEVTLDSRINVLSTSIYSYSFGQIPTESVSGNVYTYHFDSIPVFGSANIYFYDSISCSAVVGDTLYSKINTTYSPSACVDSFYSFNEHERILTLSYDPNNKETASHLGENIAANEALDYVINFQNTGTDTAFTVTLVDTLPSQIIPQSLIPLNSSHEYTYHFKSNNVIKFVFNNINLPDSGTNQAGSNGFVSFRVMQTANNPLGTIIKNRAAIYFDYNEPIITNYTYNIIPLVTSANQSYAEGNVKVMPNPFSDATRFVFTNKGKNTKATISIYDVTGKLVDEVRNIAGNSFEYKNDQLTEQLYFYKVFDEEKQLGVGKLIIKK